MTPVHLVLLAEDHDLTGFVSGEEPLDTWLTRHALSAQRANLARTFLALAGGDVLGFFSLTTGSITHEEAPRRYSRGMPRHRIPTILIARLAVDRRYQRHGLGSTLLAEALRRVAAASRTVAARLVVVDAIDDRAAAFYRRAGFVDGPGGSRRLYRKVGDIRRSLEES